MQRRQLLIFVEGERTEDTYVKFWWRRNRDKVVVTVDPRPGPPMALVERAIAKKEREEKEERRGRGAAHDEVWCVFDVDQHQQWQAAISKAERHGINVALSNPCLELWFILHYEDQTAHIETQQAVKRARTLIKCGKTPSEAALEDLADRYESAVQRARALDEKHVGDGSPGHSNPSSGAWRLIDQIVTANRQ